MRLRAILFLLATCAAGTGGCGSDDEATAKREVRAVAREFVRSIAERDYRQVCRMVTTGVKAEWARFARRNPKHFSTGGCPAFAADFYRGAPRTLREDIATIERATVEVEGDRATITAHPSDRRPGKDAATVCEHVDGRWLLGD